MSHDNLPSPWGLYVKMNEINYNKQGCQIRCTDNITKYTQINVLSLTKNNVNNETTHVTFLSTFAAYTTLNTRLNFQLQIKNN